MTVQEVLDEIVKSDAAAVVAPNYAINIPDAAPPQLQSVFMICSRVFCYITCNAIDVRCLRQLYGNQIGSVWQFGETGDGQPLAIAVDGSVWTTVHEIENIIDSTLWLKIDDTLEDFMRHNVSEE